jgi:hypothetical protein
MELHDRFHDWLKERIDSFAMSDLIHEFHDGPARDLYVIYNRLNPEMQVARALARGILTEDEVTPQLHEELSNAIEFFKEGARRESDDAAV